jgi:addiction module HigA family antidote
MIRVNPRRINEIVNEKRGISADTALRLATFFGNSPEFWLGLQADYDLEVAMDEAGEDIQRDVQPLEA